MSIKNFLKKITGTKIDDSNKNNENSDINKIVNCPQCGSDKTFVKWLYTVYSIDKETICPNCGLIKREPWMNIRRTQEGANTFHQKNGLIYIEIEYQNKEKELVVPLKGDYDNEYENKVEIHKKDCLLFKSDPINKDNFIIIVKGIYDNKISKYILIDCKHYNENFYKCDPSYIFELSEENFIKIKEDINVFNSIAIDFYNQISSVNKNSNLDKPIKTCQPSTKINTYTSSKSFETEKKNENDSFEINIVNDECLPCSSCKSLNTFIVCEETTDVIYKTIICPKCGFRKNILNKKLNRTDLELNKFQEKFGNKHIRVEYRNGTVKELTCINKNIAEIMFIPIQKCILIKNVSKTNIIAIIKGSYNNQTSYYLLTNCYDPEIYEGVIICEKQYFQLLDNDDFAMIKNNPNCIDKIADKYLKK